MIIAKGRLTVDNATDTSAIDGALNIVMYT